MPKKSLTFYYVDESFKINDSVPMTIMINLFKELDKLGYKEIDPLIPKYNIVVFPKDMKIDKLDNNLTEEDFRVFDIGNKKEKAVGLLIKPDLVFRASLNEDINYFKTTKRGELKVEGLLYVKSKNKAKI